MMQIEPNKTKALCATTVEIYTINRKIRKHTPKCSAKLQMLQMSTYGTLWYIL